MALDIFICTLELHTALIILLLSCFVYQFILKTWWFFDNLNLKYYRGAPLLGSFYKSIIGQDNEAQLSQKIYQQFPNEQIIGMYDFFGHTSYMLRDPELVKQITITDFDHFANRRFEFDAESDPLLGRSLISLRDDKWRKLRTTMSPAFTGSKMRLMHKLMVETTNQFIDALHTEVGGEVKTYEARDLAHRFTCDVIGSCAFGININSVRDPDNDFMKAGTETTVVEGWRAFKLFGFVSIPSVMRFFRCKLIPEKFETFFRNIINKNVEQREKHGIVRNDMIDLLLKAKNGKLSPVDAEEEAENKMGFATAMGTNMRTSSGIFSSKPFAFILVPAG